MPNLYSQEIQVFPSTKRGVYQRSSRLISEENLTNIVNKLIDKDAFVIRHDTPYMAEHADDPLQFNIHGYYFLIPHASSVINLVGNTDSIYANIITDTATVTVEGNTYEYTELYGQDTGSAVSWYTGVSFTPNAPDTSALTETQTRYSLKILERDNHMYGDWRIPNESMYKYEGQSVFGDINLIDGGVV